MQGAAETGNQEKACVQWGPFSFSAESYYPGGKSSRTRICYPPGGHSKGQNEEVRTCNEDQYPSTLVLKDVWTSLKNDECKYANIKGVCKQSSSHY